MCLDLSQKNLAKNVVDWWPPVATPVDASQALAKATLSLGCYQSVSERGTNTTACPLLDSLQWASFAQRLQTDLAKTFFKTVLKFEALPIQPSFLPTSSSFTEFLQDLKVHLYLLLLPPPLYFKSAFPQNFLHTESHLGVCFLKEGTHKKNGRPKEGRSHFFFFFASGLRSANGG